MDSEADPQTIPTPEKGAYARRRLVAQLIDGGDSDLADYDPSARAWLVADDICAVFAQAIRERDRVIRRALEGMVSLKPHRWECDCGACERARDAMKALGQ